MQSKSDIASVRFAYKSVGEYIEINFSRSGCVSIADLERIFGVKPNYTQAGLVVVDGGFEFQQDALKRTIYLDNLEFWSADARSVSGVLMKHDVATCISRMNVDSEPSGLFSDKPN